MVTDEVTTAWADVHARTWNHHVDAPPVVVPPEGYGITTVSLVDVHALRTMTLAPNEWDKLP